MRYEEIEGKSPLEWRLCLGVEALAGQRSDLAVALE